MDRYLDKGAKLYNQHSSDLLIILAQYRYQSSMIL